jgi:hypothetical protein
LPGIGKAILRGLDRPAREAMLAANRVIDLVVGEIDEGAPGRSVCSSRERSSQLSGLSPSSSKS